MLAPTINRKDFCTTQAEAARAGAILQHIEADDGKPLLVLTREAMTAQLNSLDQVRCVLANLANDVEVSL